MHTSLCVCVCEHSHGNYSVHQKTTKVILNITRKCGFALAAVVFLLKCTDNVTSLSGKTPKKEPPAKKHLLERVTLFFIFILFFLFTVFSFLGHKTANLHIDKQPG